ncbi:MAG TPA: serine hydrolase [Longimicrobiaceae bacterium]
MTGVACSARGSEVNSPRRAAAATRSPDNAALVDRVRQLEAAVPRLLRDGEVPGLAMALVEGGRVVWTRGFGVRNATTGEPVTEQTVFEAASLSKPVVAYAVLRLVDQGRLDLDAPLARYLSAPYSRDLEADSRLDQVTARRVLTHTSGLPNQRTRGQPLQLHFAPGARFSYSGEGFLYLQQAIERITGESLDVAVRRLVFAPIGMTSSAFVWQESYDTLKAYGHDQAGRVTGRRRSTAASAAASLETTAGDYARFLAAVLREEGLAASTARDMLRPQVQVDAGCVVCLGRANGSRSSTLGWGLGWGLAPGPGGEPSIWHWGDNGDMKAFAMGLTDARRGVVLFTNGANGLSIAPEIVSLALGISSPELATPGLTWAGYERYDSPARRVLREVLARGDEAIRALSARQRRTPAPRATMSPERPLTEREMVSLGEQLLARDRVSQGIAVLTLAAELFPDSSAAHAALGDAYRSAGDTASALRSFRRVLEISPSDSAAAAAIRRLSGPVVRLSSAQMATYTGTYDTPLGRLVVTLEGNQLMGRLGEEGAATLVPESVYRFSVGSGNATVEFTQVTGGRAMEVVIQAGGQELRGHRIQ